jgi:hypothetical protein
MRGSKKKKAFRAMSATARNAAESMTKEEKRAKRGKFGGVYRKRTGELARRKETPILMPKDLVKL